MRTLEVARRLAQTGRSSGLSDTDIAQEIGVRTASIDDHFPTTSDRGRDLIRRYLTAFRGVFAQFDGGPDDPREKLCRDVRAILDSLLDGERMCLRGMMGAGIATLPPTLAAEVRTFLDADETWPAGVISTSRDAGIVRVAGSPEDEARLIFANLEGGRWSRVPSPSRIASPLWRGGGWPPWRCSLDPTPPPWWSA